MSPADNKETGLGSSNQEAFLSAGKNTGVVIASCSRMELCPHSYFWWFGYFWGTWVSFVTTDEFLMRVIKITSKIVVSWPHSLPLYFLRVATFLLVCFICLKDNTFDKRKNVFYLTLKPLTVSVRLSAGGQLSIPNFEKSGTRKKWVGGGT